MSEFFQRPSRIEHKQGEFDIPQLEYRRAGRGNALGSAVRIAGGPAFLAPSAEQSPQKEELDLFPEVESSAK